MTSSSIRLMLILWTVAWAAMGVATIVYWNSMPSYLAWPLSIVDVMLAPDIKALKKHVFGIGEAQQAGKDNLPDDSDTRRDREESN